MKKRLDWVDAAKGIGILLVVMAHVPIPDSLKQFIYSFHMPLFFLLSGMMFRSSSRPAMSFIQKKAKSLLLPYLYFSIITYVFWFSVTRFFAFKGQTDIDPFVPFTGIFISNADEARLTHNPAIWFLTTLFLVEILFFFMHRLTKGKPAALILLTVLCGGAGYASTFLLDQSLPWNANVALTAVVFYSIGFLAKQWFVELKTDPTLLLCTGLLVLTAYMQSYNSRIDMRVNDYGDLFIFYVCALLGSAAVIYLSFKLKTSPILTYLGRNSIVILVLQFAGIDIMKAFVYYGLGINISDTAQLSWTLFYTIGTLLLMVPCISFLSKYPMLLGKPAKAAHRYEQKTSAG
ncbi:MULTISPECIES: acyltransferase family protein [Bacillus]|uniref:Acyltransferase n=1 Tax=Bacillus pumilus TaxID=1408 RepID=A0A2G8IXQ2_BACPU|nr:MULTISPECIES: acyltransferase family protein [Bacillus]MCC9089655.1 acyltransferase family protein [Bacillus pumilus]MED1747679.1 acyltransferase family protein [Bacillus zhangzhouensis]PIK28229.1 acyltransferase [Bacillus pumilus]